jgi:transcriptional regulator with XRE-family HTH domain
MDINEATAKALQAARAVSGMTYEEVSEKSGVSAPTVYRMFGAKRDIKVPQLHDVAEAMGVTVVDIMQDAERIQTREQRNTQESTDREYRANHITDLGLAAKAGDIDGEQEAYEEMP